MMTDHAKLEAAAEALWEIYGRRYGAMVQDPNFAGPWDELTKHWREMFRLIAADVAALEAEPTQDSASSTEEEISVECMRMMTTDGGLNIKCQHSFGHREKHKHDDDLVFAEWALDPIDRGHREALQDAYKRGFNVGFQRGLETDPSS